MKTNIAFQLFLLSLIGVAGTSISILLPIAVPPSILGMLLLLILLVTKVIRLHQIANVGHFLLTYMGILFIPPVVDIVSRYHLLGNQIIQFVGICIISTILTFLSSLSAAKLVMHIQDKNRKRGETHV